jgi:phenylalanyl-tRNA synthetase beta chain
MLNRLKITDYEIVKAKNNLDVMHPGIYAELYINNEYAGLLGKLHPEKEHKLNINKTFVFELKLDVINENYNLDLVMQEIPKYPAVSRDLALVIDRNVLASQLIEEVKKAGKKTLKSVEIFDLYEGDNIDKDKKSIALSLVLQSNEKTLETKEVDVVIERILKHLETELNASLR